MSSRRRRRRRRGGVVGQLAHARTHQSGQDRITLLQRCGPLGPGAYLLAWPFSHIIRIPSGMPYRGSVAAPKICNKAGFATRELTLANYG